MENEEKAKVIIDCDKYQELLAKANLNENAIQEIKDVTFKEGYDKGYRLGYSLYKNIMNAYLNLVTY